MIGIVIIGDYTGTTIGIHSPIPSYAPGSRVILSYCDMRKEHGGGGTIRGSDYRFTRSLKDHLIWATSRRQKVKTYM